MLYRASVIALGLLAATSAQAWTRTVDAGTYQIVARGAPGTSANLLRLSLSAQPVAGSGSAQLHAWFLDADGMILGQAPLIGTGLVRTADAGGVAIPAGATTIAVLAEPNAAASGVAPATALIALPRG